MYSSECSGGGRSHYSYGFMGIVADNNTQGSNAIVIYSYLVLGAYQETCSKSSSSTTSVASIDLEQIGSREQLSFRMSRS